MPKLHALLAAGATTLLLAPTLLARGDEERTLTSALRAIDRAMDVLTGVQSRIAADPSKGPELVQPVTEAPILDARRRDERLASLRGEVDRLRTELGRLEGTTPAAVPTTAGSVTTGLDDTTRSVLEHLASARGPAGGTDASSAEGPASDAYVADPVGLARACYHAGRYAEGAAAIAGHEDLPGALFWRARCRERLGAVDAALDDLRRLLARDPAGAFADRARQDVEFLQWKKDFLERLPREPASAESGGTRSAAKPARSDR